MYRCNEGANWINIGLVCQALANGLPNTSPVWGKIPILYDLVGFTASSSTTKNEDKDTDS